MKRYTAPIVFGLTTALILALVILPTFYAIWKTGEFAKNAKISQSTQKV